MSNPYSAYKKQSVSTMTPVEVVIKLYSETERQLAIGVNSIRTKDIRKAHESLMKATHAEIRNFRYTCSDPDNDGVRLEWIGNKSHGPVTFGVPYAIGEADKQTTFSLTTNDGRQIDTDTWRLASWADGSAKWQAFAAVIPQGTDYCVLRKTDKKKVSKKNRQSSKEENEEWGEIPPFYLTLNNKVMPVEKHETERQGMVSMLHKYSGRNFVMRAYSYKGSKEVKIVHTLIVDSVLNAEGLRELGDRKSVV